MTTFLDPKGKVYKIGNIEFPIKENVTGGDMKVLREMQNEALNDEEGGKTLNQIEDLRYQAKWYNEVSKVAFDKTYDELVEDMSEPDAKQLLGEAYIFLTKFGTIERLNRYENVLTEVEQQSKKLAETTPKSSKDSS